MSQSDEDRVFAGRPALECLLRPRSVAIVGASETPGSLGEGVLSNLEQAKFTGALYLINPKRQQVRGHACLSTIDELPEGVDCAVLAIPNQSVLDAAVCCARRSVHSLIVFSSGFAESGPQGLAAQRQLEELARSHGMILEGPNCLGLVNHVDRIPLTFVRTQTHQPSRAGVAILSQSGALAAVFGVSLRHHGIEISYSVSTGNEAALNVEDALEYLLLDPLTEVFALIVEQFRHPRRFLSIAARARALGKFIVLLHPGKSPAARSSATTHTGAMAGHYDVMRTIVTAAGVLVVDTMEEFHDVCQLVIHRPALPRRGAAVFAESGAFRALALDLCESIGLDLPAFSDATAGELRKALPPFILAANPLDLTAHALVDPGLYGRALATILTDDRIGSVVLTIILTDESTCDLKFPPILAALRNLDTQKPILFAAMDEGAPLQQIYIDQLRDLGVPFYPSPERALRALACVTRFPAAPAAEAAKPVSPPGKRIALLDGANPEYRSKALLAEYGIPVPQGSLVRCCDEALSIAAKIGFPVALKAQSADLSHKSDAGGVQLNIKNPDALKAAWNRLEQNLASSAQSMNLDGVLVETMAEPGLELIVGARNDPQWGPVLLLGAGGVLAEAMRDVQLVAPDSSKASIVAKFDELRCAPLLRGFRSSAPCDVQSAAGIVATLGEIVGSFPTIQEIEINPLLLYAEGRGAMAVDALIVVRSEPVAQGSPGA
jgi:acetate---CoA ligase (ADP-forming)